jgi:hypothetical protein
MDYEELRSALDDRAGERSQLSKGSREVGRKLANLPD